MKNKPVENFDQIPWDSLDQLDLTPEFIYQPGGDYLAKIRDREGNVISEMPFIKSVDYDKINSYTPGGSSIPEHLRGKGLASDLYSRLEKLTGGKIIPDDMQTLAGEALHERHGMGKKFGMSEEELISKLTPEEKMSRNVRKNVLNNILENIASGNYGTNRVDITPEVNTDLNHQLKGQDKKNLRSLIGNVLKRASLDFDPTSKFDQKLELDLTKITPQIPEALSKVKSFAPIIGKGLAAGAGGALSLAAEASDSPEAGDILGQEALERDIAAERTQREIESAGVPKDVKLKALELFKKNRLPY